jgi:hypothetical protein
MLKKTISKVFVMNGKSREGVLSIGNKAQQEYAEEQNSWVPVWDFHFHHKLTIEEGTKIFACYTDEQLKEIKVKCITAGNDLVHENTSDCELGILRGTLDDGTIIARDEKTDGPIGYAYLIDSRGHHEISIGDSNRKCKRLDLICGEILKLKGGQHIAFVLAEGVNNMILAKNSQVIKEKRKHSNTGQIQIFETTTED